jgi:hypothetical protein
MSIMSHLPRLRTTPIHASKEPEAPEAALREALFEMLRRANLVAPTLEAEEAHHTP